MADAVKLMEAIDRLVWNTVSLRLVASGGAYASPGTRLDIERLVGESRKQLTDELTKALAGAVARLDSVPTADSFDGITGRPYADGVTAADGGKTNG